LCRHLPLLLAKEEVVVVVVDRREEEAEAEAEAEAEEPAVRAGNQRRWTRGREIGGRGFRGVLSIRYTGGGESK